MKKIAFCLSIFIAGCGYDGHYRYECQDPANWESDECNPPICNVDGMCTETLLGFDPLPEEPEAPTSDTTTEDVSVVEETIAP